MLARAVIIWDLACAWGSTSKFRWLLAGGGSSSPRESLHKAVWDVPAGFPQEWVIVEKEQEQSCSIPYSLISEVTYHHFWHILLFTQTKCGTMLGATIQGMNTQRWRLLGAFLEADCYHLHRQISPAYSYPFFFLKVKTYFKIEKL